MSKYTFQIIDDRGQIVASMKPRETDDVVVAVVNRLISKGVGLGRTTKHVAADATAALEEIIHELKNQVRPTRA